jgi:SAM-dependent methyltransferase
MSNEESAMAQSHVRSEPERRLLSRVTLDHLHNEFERLRQRSPWMASFIIQDRLFGSGLNHDQDVRPPDFFRLVSGPRRILELGSCQGGGTFQLAKMPGVREVVAIEGRAYNLEKARFVQQILEINNVLFLQGDLESFDFAPLGRFDAAYCVGVLYHLPSPWELLAKLERLTDVFYINTHFCPLSHVAMNLHGYNGKKWLEAGHADPLSGMSSWSFWPTLQALVQMLLDAGFTPDILETDTLGPGQSPHGTTILARRTVTLSAQAQRNLLEKTRQVVSNLPPSAGTAPSPRVSWWRRPLSRLKRLVGPILSS